MGNSDQMLIDAAASRSLIEWETVFSRQLLTHARKLAQESGSSKITVEYLRNAVGSAIEDLTIAVQQPPYEDDQRAA